MRNLIEQLHFENAQISADLQRSNPQLKLFDGLNIFELYWLLDCKIL